MIMVLDNLLSKAANCVADGTNTNNQISLSRLVVERMRQSSDRQLELINSLLESHVNNVHGIIIKPQPLAIAPLIENAIADLLPLIEKEQAKIQLHIAENLPLAIADSTHIIRVFQNLLANALKHNPPNLTLTITIEIDHQSNQNMLLCKVADDGVGITKEQSEYLFELYSQGNKTNNLNRRSLSLGLGLYICRQIVQAHGGAIGVNIPAIGTEFWFTLPYKKE